MKIVSIFADDLFAFQYDKDDCNIFNKLFSNWEDPQYIFEFFKQNSDLILGNDFLNIFDEFDFFQLVSSEVEGLEEFIINESKNKNLERFFVPLDRHEASKVFLIKSKAKKYILRIYALKIEENCFIITGGCIKITQKMKDAANSNAELVKLHSCNDFLREENIIDRDSFFEYINS